MKKVLRSPDRIAALFVVAMRVTLLHLGITLALTTFVQAHPTEGQSVLDRPVSVRLTNVTLREALGTLEKKVKTQFVYSSLTVSDANRVNLLANGELLSSVLTRLLNPLNIEYSLYNDQIILSKVPAGATPVRVGGLTMPLLPVSDGVPVRGRVRATDLGAGLPGVSVVVKGTTAGTTTDAQGNYSLSVPTGNATLVFSFVGYTPQTLNVSNRSVVDVSLAPDESSLSEVVVIGYGTQRKQDLTGAVSQANLKGVDEMPVPSVDQALTGRIAGMQITSSSGQPGAGTSIRIRGSNSLSGNNEPLYVIDGFPIINDNSALDTRDALGQTNQANGTNQGNPQGVLNWLNPADIESIEVLKDASSTAIYGSRGANGVIIITTKKAKSGEVRLNFSSSVGVGQQIRNGVELLTGDDYARLNNEANTFLKVKLIYDGVKKPRPGQIGEGTNWLDVISQRGLTQSYSLNFSGGRDVQFSGSGSYFSQEGTLKNSRIQRGSLRLNLQTKLTKWLTLSNNSTYSLAALNGPPADTRDRERYGPFEAALNASPAEPVYNPDGSLYFNPADAYIAGVQFSPLALSYDVLNRNTTNTFLNNLSLKATIADGLTFESRAGVFNNSVLRDIYYNSTTTFNGYIAGGLAGKNSRNVTSYLLENFATYTRKFGVNAINAVGGYSYQLTNTNDLNTGASGFPNDNLLNENLAAGQTQYPTETNKLVDKLSSYFVRINNVIADRFIATFTARLDGSSKFGSGNKWAFFPSGAVSWRVKEESFLRNNDLFSDLKLRFSYGLSGNQAIRSLQSKPLLATVQVPFGTQILTGVRPTDIGNPNLRWETTRQFNAGLDFGFFNQRLTGSLNYYVKNTVDLIQQRAIPQNSGFVSLFDNIGSISNKGIELELHGAVINAPSGFRWNIDANVAHNRQIMTDLGLGKQDTLFVPIGGFSTQLSARGIALIKGQEVGLFYGYKRDGLYQTQTETPIFRGSSPGSVKLKDLNGDGEVTSADQTVIGNPNPKLIFGLINNFAYKSFDLSLQIQGVVGGDIMNIGQLRQESPDFNGNRLKTVLDYWSPTNTDAVYPAPGRLNGAEHLSDFIIHDGSYVRLKAVTLGYNLFPKNTKIFRSMRAYVSAVNLLTLTGYTGFSPEVSAFGQSNLSRNIDYNTAPQQRTVSLGLNLGF